VDKWKYFDITHRDHLLCNPMAPDKFERLVDLVRLEPGARVLEIAMGKGEFIVRLAERYGVGGVGIDLSPFCVADARRKVQQHVPEADLNFVEMDGADYEPAEGVSFDLAACIGASWIYGGHRGTLAYLKRVTKPGGWVVAGEPYWRSEPADEYLEAIGASQSTYGTHYENVTVGETMGLTLAYTLVSNEDDWDEYEGLQWYAAEGWARNNPDDPDVGKVLARVRMGRDEYLKWGRDTLGWAIYLFRNGER
jgi:SAM-dependent methyltransferase